MVEEWVGGAKDPAIAGYIQAGLVTSQTVELLELVSGALLHPAPDMTSTPPSLMQAFFSAIGSAFVNALTYPLDLVLT